MTDYIQTKWRDGSAFNHNLTSDEYFYNQIFEAVKKNVSAGTLPQFSRKTSSMPVELSTGKIINDENLIALEQIAASNNYNSSVWIFGDVLEKLRSEGIRLNFKKDAQPALCITKYANATHLFGNELYIAEGGAKTKAQFLYNLDSLDERSQEAVKKHVKTAQENVEAYSNENFSNYISNVKKARTEKVPALEDLKNSLRIVCEKAAGIYTTSPDDSNKIDFTTLVNSQARHVCSLATGSSIRNEINPQAEANCYSMFERIISETANQEIEPWKAGKEICKALHAGTQYAKSYTAKDFNLEHRKIRDETHLKNQSTSKNRDLGMSR